MKKWHKEVGVYYGKKGMEDMSNLSHVKIMKRGAELIAKGYDVRIYIDYYRNSNPLSADEAVKSIAYFTDREKNKLVKSKI